VLDLSAIYAALETGDDRGRAGYHPAMMVPDGANKGSFVQAYNVQIAVDAHAQVIVAADVTQQANDKQQLEPMAMAIVASVGMLADVTSADAGYFCEKAIEAVGAMGTELLVPPYRQKHDEARIEEMGAPAADASLSDRMRHKLRTKAGRQLYRMRKAIVEPVFGQIKSGRGLARVVTRGLENVRSEFLFIAMTHNLLKLFRSGTTTALATA
jgi:hypothetical protein